MASQRSITLTVAGVALGAALTLAVVAGMGDLHVPSLAATVAFSTLFLLAIISEWLSVRVTDEGTSVSVAFLPELAAVLLLGPLGAGLLAGSSAFLWHAAFSKRDWRKSLYNAASSVLGVVGASSAFVLAGGTFGLTGLNFKEAFPPFLVAAVVYFTLNSVLVAFILARVQDRRTVDLWMEVVGGSILLDIAISPLVFIVAFLYIEWGLVGLLTAVIPILGIRLSYVTDRRAQQAGRDLLRVMVKSIEAQDLYTSGHSVRVADGAKRIAVGMGLGRKRVQTIETAALLHDIGKIDAEYLPILQKEGELTDEEYALIQEHPERGVDILSSVDTLDDEIIEAVRHHHERMDGTGYPDGVSGDDIPLGARIIAVSDTVDAMRTARPYRDAVPMEEVREEVLRCRGTQFDPEVVDAALKVGLLDTPPRDRVPDAGEV